MKNRKGVRQYFQNRRFPAQQAINFYIHARVAGTLIDPHFYIGSTYQSPRVEEDGMTNEELEAYQAGYRYNEKQGHYKEW